MPPSSASAYASLTDFNKNRATPEAALTSGESKYGVSGLRSGLETLRGITNNLATSIKNVDPSVTGRTQGGLVTEAARSRIVNNERAPLVSDYNQTYDDLSNTQKDLSDAQSNSSTWASALLASDQNKYKELSDIYTSALTQEQAQRDEAFRQQQAAEAKRQFDAQLAESRAARASSGSSGGGLSLGGLGGGGTAAATSQIDPTQAALGFAKQQKNALLAAGNVPAFAREAVLRQLKAQFGLSDQAAANIIYRDVFADGWDGTKSQPKLTAVKPSNQIQGLKGLY